jgi:hypothetical protein
LQAALDRFERMLSDKADETSRKTKEVAEKTATETAFRLGREEVERLKREADNLHQDDDRRMQAEVFT